MWIFIAVCLAGLIPGCDNEGEQPVEPVAAGSTSTLQKASWGEQGWARDVEEMAQRFVTAIREKDIEGFMACWWNSPDATLVLENGTVVRGYDNIRGGEALF